MNALFNVKWKSGDTTWLPYHQIDHLDALGDYFEAIGISDISELTSGGRENVPDPNLEPNMGTHEAPVVAAVNSIQFSIDLDEDSGLEGEEMLKESSKLTSFPQNMSASQNPSATTTTPTQPLSWMKRVKANKIVTYSPRGLHYATTPQDIIDMLEFDRLLRLPNAMVTKYDIPMSYR
ncbi:hypothetical protein F5880DRAFT_1512804 [Lentinula raphanica]|nr:hypothetical protein F5880DRAFT_1512804 [Lentinula raphanica]